MIPSGSIGPPLHGEAGLSSAGNNGGGFSADLCDIPHDAFHPWALHRALSQHGVVVLGDI